MRDRIARCIGEDFKRFMSFYMTARSSLNAMETEPFFFLKVDLFLEAGLIYEPWLG